MVPSLISAEWLLKHLDNSNIIILDASFKGVNNTQNTSKEVQIKNAIFFDLKHFKNHQNPFPNSYPTPDFFQKEIQKLGITNKHHLVIYDEIGIHSAPRVWWLFRLMGHEKVSILNGGLPHWISKNYPTEKKKIQKTKSSNYQVNFQPSLVVDYPFVAKNSIKNKHLLIDARAENRFNGTAPEPRKELPSGKIPHSINIPYQKVVKNGFLQNNNTLKTLFKKALNSKNTVIFSCGSGITACILHFALEQISSQNKAIYDGSWTEWASKTYF